jgi:DNA-directed RNA polymerase I, II, and III subunit RPABC5
MIIPIKCFTCGKVLADKYEYYLIEVRKIKLANDPNDGNKITVLGKQYNKIIPAASAPTIQRRKFGKRLQFLKWI